MTDPNPNLGQRDKPCVKPSIKSEVVRVARLKGWTESKTVASLVEQALAANLAESFAVMLHPGRCHQADATGKQPGGKPRP